MKEINYKDMKFNPFRSALPLRSSKNLIGDELTNEASAEGKLACTMPCKEEVGDSQWMLVTAGDEATSIRCTSARLRRCW